MIYLTILAALVFVMIAVVLPKIFNNFQPSDRRVREDLEKMKAELTPYTGELIPINKEELEAFSTSQVNQILKKGMTTTARGVFTTIYDEPIVAYSYKKYIGSGNNGILYVRTAEHEMAFRIRNKGIEIMIDDQVVGTFKDNGVLYGAKSNRMLARVAKDQPEFLPVLVKDREVGSVTKSNEKPGKNLSKRAFEFIKDDLNKEEEAVFLSLAVLELVQRTIDTKK